MFRLLGSHDTYTYRISKSELKAALIAYAERDPTPENADLIAFVFKHAVDRANIFARHEYEESQAIERAWHEFLRKRPESEEWAELRGAAVSRAQDGVQQKV